MGSRTPLFDTHAASGAKIVDFGGWDMPLHYGSQIEEHHAVRRDAGMFDVSHMCPVDVCGADARVFLRYLVANNVDRLTQSGKALYACMLNHAGGVVDDLIIYFLRDDWFRVVVNAGTSDMGQGARTIFAQIAAQELGAPLEWVRVVMGDTAVVPDGQDRPDQVLPVAHPAGHPVHDHAYGVRHLSLPGWQENAFTTPLK